MTIEVHEKARVAATRSGFIAPTAAAGGDAPPIHDTPLTATLDRKVAWPPKPPPPRRFTAINLPAIPVVISMTTVVLILTAHAITTVTGSRIDAVQVLLVVVLMIVSTVVAALMLAGRRLVRLKSMTSRPVAGDATGRCGCGVWNDAGDDGSEIVVLGRHVIAQEDSAPLLLQGGPRPGGRRPEPVSPQREGVRPGAPPKAASRAALGNTENSLPSSADDEEAHQ